MTQISHNCHCCTVPTSVVFALQVLRPSYERIATKFYGGVRGGTMNN